MSTINRKEATKKWHEIVQDMETKKSELDNLLGAARQSNEQIVNVLNDSNSKLSVISSTEGQANQKVEAIDRSLSSVNQKEEQAKKELEAINQIHTEAENKKSDIEKLRSETEELLKQNNEQSDKISDLLQKAAAGSLFNSFNVRKQEYEAASKFWGLMIILSVLLLVAGAVYISWIFQIQQSLSYTFLIKLSVSLPIIYWLIFSTSRYVKNKRYEEEYAFKSAISLSLEAYRDLIKRESREATKAEVIPFITEAVGKIFSSPSIMIAKHSHKEDVNMVEGLLDKLLQLVSKIR